MPRSHRQRRGSNPVIPLQPPLSQNLQDIRPVIPSRHPSYDLPGNRHPSQNPPIFNPVIPPNNPNLHQLNPHDFYQAIPNGHSHSSRPVIPPYSNDPNLHQLNPQNFYPANPYGHSHRSRPVIPSYSNGPNPDQRNPPNFYPVIPNPDQLNPPNFYPVIPNPDQYPPNFRPVIPNSHSRSFYPANPPNQNGHNRSGHSQRPPRYSGLPLHSEKLDDVQPITRKERKTTTDPIKLEDRMGTPKLPPSAILVGKNVDSPMGPKKNR